MEMAALIVTFAGVVLAGVAAVAAVVQAKSARASQIAAELARDESREARDAAGALAKEANAAFLRQAEAQERANAIEESKIPPRNVKWQVVRHSKDMWRLVNIGTIAAIDVEMIAGNKTIVDEDSCSPRVDTNEHVVFACLFGFGGGTATATVKWLDEGTHERHQKDFRIT